MVVAVVLVNWHFVRLIFIYYFLFNSAKTLSYVNHHFYVCLLLQCFHTIDMVTGKASGL